VHPGWFVRPVVTFEVGEFPKVVYFDPVGGLTDLAASGQ